MLGFENAILKSTHKNTNKIKSNDLFVGVRGGQAKLRFKLVSA